jgi:GTP pyrophosphokinase
MHDIAEYGIAAHWLYKAIDKSKHGKKKLTQREKEYLDKLSWMRKLMEMQATDNPDANQFMENIKTDFLINEIFVFSPMGDVYPLPEGSTPVDFAFTIHSAIGFSCTGARVNGKMVPLSYELTNGDIVEILSGKEQNPNPDWLKFVKTSHTKNKIKNYLNKQLKDQKTKEGKELLQKELRSNSITRSEFKKSFTRLLDHYQLSENEFYYSLAKGDISSKVIIDFFKNEKQQDDKNKTGELVKPKSSEAREKKLDSSEIVVEGDTSNIMSAMAKCCNPVYGDQIVGVISRKKGISVHRADCPNIQNLKEKKIEVNWAKKKSEHKYLSQLTLIGYDRVGWFKDVLNLIAEKKINVKEAYANHKGTVTKAKLVLEVSDNKQLKDIMIRIRQMKDIYEVYRS